MADNAASDARSQVFFMLISAGMFAYFGFATSWAHQYTTGTPPVLLPMVVLLEWTLRIGAVAFGLAAIISMTGSILGPLLYVLTGLTTAVPFVVVAVWEWTNPQGYYCGVPAVLLLVFAVWNGYGSWSGLQEIRAWRRMRAAAPMPESTFRPPDDA